MKTTIEERRAATKAIEKLVFNGVSPKVDRTIGDMADDIDELDAKLEAMSAEAVRLRGLIDRDRTGLAAALGRVRKVAEGYRWIGGGEWGSYDYTERTVETIRREAGSALGQIESECEAALRESGGRADAAFHPERDAFAQLAVAKVEFGNARDALERKLDDARDALTRAIFADEEWLAWARDLGRFEVPVGVPYSDADVRASVEKRLEEIGRRAEFLNTEVLRARTLLRQQVEAGLGRFILSEVDVANHRVLVLLADDDDEDTAAQTVVGFMLPLLERLGFKVARTEVP